MSHGPSTFGTMTTSRRSPISVTSVVMSSSAHGDSSALTRVHSAQSPRSTSRPARTSPSRAGILRSTGTASSRLPSRTSQRAARSGSFAAIFSFAGSKKWIIRVGFGGMSRTGGGAPIARGFVKSRGLRTARTIFYSRVNAADFPASRKEPFDHDPAGERRRHRPGRAGAQRRASVWALPRGVRGRRRLQALAGEDGHRVRRPPVLPADDEPPPAAHQRRLRGAVPAGPQRRRRPARLLAGARDERVGRERQGDRQPRDRGAQAPGAGVPRRHAVLRVRGPREARVAVQARPRDGPRPHAGAQPGRRARGRVQAARPRPQARPGTAGGAEANVEYQPALACPDRWGPFTYGGNTGR